MSNENKFTEDEAKTVLDALKLQRSTVNTAIQKVEKQLESGVLTDSEDFGDKQFLVE